MSVGAATASRGGLLRRHRAFRLLWLSGAVSLVGDRFSLLALPVLAMTEAGATPAQVALLFAVQSLPGAVLAVPIAAYLAGRSERATMVLTDVVRAALVLGLSALAAAEALQLWHLLVAVPLVGVANTAFSVAAQAYLPRIVDRAELAEANSRFAQAASGADICGPAAAGFVIGVAGAGPALLADAASFLVSAVLLVAIDRRRLTADGPDVADAVDGLADGWWDRLRAGVRFVAGHRGLRTLIAALALFNLGGATVGALWYPYLLDGLGLSTATTGLLLTAGGVSALVAALVVQWVLRAAGLRIALPASLVVAVLALWLVPLAATGPAVGLLAAYQLAFSAAAVFIGVSAATIRQSITPLAFQGRVYAVAYTLALFAVPLGGAVASVAAGAASQHLAIGLGAAVATTSLLTLRTLIRTAQ